MWGHSKAAATQWVGGRPRQSPAECGCLADVASGGRHGRRVGTRAPHEVQFVIKHTFLGFETMITAGLEQCDHWVTGTVEWLS